jgi:hypothetical protein
MLQGGYNPSGGGTGHAIHKGNSFQVCGCLPSRKGFFSAQVPIPSDPSLDKAKSIVIFIQLSIMMTPKKLQTAPGNGIFTYLRFRRTF